MILCLDVRPGSSIEDKAAWVAGTNIVHIILSLICVLVTLVGME